MKWKRLWPNVAMERRKRYYAIKHARANRDMDDLERQLEELLVTETNSLERIRLINLQHYMHRQRIIHGWY